MRALAIATLAIVAASTQGGSAASTQLEDSICATIKGRVAGFEKLTASQTSKWWCDFVVDQFQPKGFWIVGLHSGAVTRGSDLIGWYALRRKDGRVISWDNANDAPGKPL